MPVFLFVYGTLKRGYQNHAGYCRSALAVRPAHTSGCIYHLSDGYPAMAVPDAEILARGTRDLAADVALQRSWTERLAEANQPPSPGDRVFGELIEFAAERPLRRIDVLEGFRPGRESLFLRVLVRGWVMEGDAPLAAWTYVQPQPRGTLLESGVWS